MKMKGLYINDVQDRNKWIRYAEEWSTLVNWEEDPAIRTENNTCNTDIHLSNLIITKPSANEKLKYLQNYKINLIT